MAEFSTFPALPASIQTVTLDSVQFRARLTWRRRPNAWYLDLYALDETPLVLGRRLSPGWNPLLGLSVPDGPDGFLLVRGYDGYIREDLGERLRLLYYTRAELVAATPAAESDGIVVTA